MTPSRTAGRTIEAVVIGASAGGIDALFTVLAGLGPTCAAPVTCVVHLPPDLESRLPEIFASRLGVPVLEAIPGAPARAGTVYFAPPAYHLLVEPDKTFSLSCEPPVHFSRPSIDVLFESCAQVWGSGLLAIVLTGANDDGARGLAAVRAAGGLAVVQRPGEAQYPTMPQAALDLAGADMILPLGDIRDLLHNLNHP